MRWHDVGTCNSCGSTQHAPYLISFVPNWYEKRPLTLDRCTSCDLVWATPRPDPVELYKNYFDGAEKAAEIVRRKLERPNIVEVHRRAIESAVYYAERPVARLFDVGCGAGTVMTAASELGIEAQGNDLNRAAIDRLRGLGFTAHLGFTKDLHLEGSFDVVMNLDYLEHSYEPQDDLRFCFDILNPGGVLYLKTLYLGCPDHMQDDTAWRLFGNAHFHYFFPDTLRKLVLKCGFEIKQQELAQLITIVAVKPGT